MTLSMMDQLGAVTAAWDAEELLVGEHFILDADQVNGWDTHTGMLNVLCLEVVLSTGQRPTTDVPEWLPHQQFWYSLGGLVVDGVMCCARCGQSNAPPGVAKHDPDLATSFLTTDDELRRNSWATPPGSPSPAGLPAGGRASTGTMSPSMSPNSALL